MLQILWVQLEFCLDMLGSPNLHTMQVGQLNIAILVQVQHLKEVGDDVDSAHEEIAEVILHTLTEAASTL